MQSLVMKNRVFFYVMLFSSFIAVGQIDFNNYKPLVSSGVIPNDFLYAFKYDATENLARLEKENRRVFKARQRFILAGHDVISETMRSGTVLFGDEVSIYLNKVLNFVIKDKPHLKGKVRIYASKSGYTNAYCTSQGIILINMGFLAKVQSEAELGFVLTHEIGHFEEQHALNNVIETVKLNRKMGKYRKVRPEERLEKLYERSKSNELECDSLAAEWILESEFNLQGGIGVLDILLRSEIPFLNTEFDMNFFDECGFDLPSFMFLKETKEIDPDEEKYDKYSTHPNVRTRKTAFKRITKKGNGKSEKFLVSEKEFKRVQKIARFEVVNARLLEREYGDAIYTAACMLNDYPNNKFLKRSIGLALYGLAKYATINDLHKAARSANKIQGESQQVHFLLRNLTKSQINVLALNYLQYLRANDSSPVLEEMVKNLVTDLVCFHDLKKEDIDAAEAFNFTSDEVEFASVTESREQMLARRKLIKKYRSFHLLYLKDEFATQAYAKYYDAAVEKNTELESLDDLREKDYDKLKRKKYKSVLKNGLGIKKTIYFIEPIFELVKDKYKSIKNYKKGIEARVTFEAKLKSYLSQEMSGDFKFLSVNELDKNDIDQFNILQKLKNWENEKLSHTANEVVPLSSVDLASQISKDMNYVCGIGAFRGIGWYIFYVANLETGKTLYSHRVSDKISSNEIWTYLKKDLQTIIK
ncbi:MAG: hypothetical protein ACJAZ2_000919 [Glaciecola sp.]|jgi:hypothetical protein